MIYFCARHQLLKLVFYFSYRDIILKSAQKNHFAHHHTPYLFGYLLQGSFELRMDAGKRSDWNIDECTGCERRSGGSYVS